MANVPDYVIQAILDSQWAQNNGQYSGGAPDPQFQQSQGGGGGATGLAINGAMGQSSLGSAQQPRTSTPAPQEPMYQQVPGQGQSAEPQLQTTPMGIAAMQSMIPQSWTVPEKTTQIGNTTSWQGEAPLPGTDVTLDRDMVLRKMQMGLPPGDPNEPDPRKRAEGIALEQKERARILSNVAPPPMSPYEEARKDVGLQKDIATLGAIENQETRQRYADKEEVDRWAQATQDELEVERIRQDQIDRANFEREMAPQFQDLLRKELEDYRNRKPPEDSFGGRMATAVALAFSSLGAGLTGGQNVVLEMLKIEQDKELNDQKAKAMRFNNIDNLYNRLLKKFGDPHSADVATRLYLQQQQMHELQALKARDMSLDAQQQLDAIKAAQAADIAQTKAAAVTGVTQKAWNTRERHVEGTPVGMSGLMSFFKAAHVPEDQKFILAATLLDNGDKEFSKTIQRMKNEGIMDGNTFRVAKWAGERRVRLPASLGGKVVFARDQAAAKLSQDQVDAIDHLEQNYDKISKVVATFGQEVNPTQISDLHNLVSQNVMLHKRAEELGAITKADQTMVEPTSLEGIWNPSFADRQSRIKLSRDYFNTRKQQTLRTLYADPMMREPLVPTFAVQPMR